MSLLPPFDTFRYHPHQEAGVRWMVRRETGDDAHHCSGGILADEMGLGKTWQTVGLLLNNPVPLTLILVPPVLQDQWSDCLVQAEIPHTILSGGGTQKPIKGSRTNVAAILATYDRAVRSVAELRNMNIERIVADEGHAFRNGHATRRFSELCGLEAPYRWILSGTPVQNREKDFLNILKWLHARYPEGTPSREIANAVMLRRTVADVRDVVTEFPEAKPRHFIHPVTLPEDSEELRVFNALVRHFKHAVENHLSGARKLELFLRIRQFMAYPPIYVDAMIKKYKDKYVRQKWEGTCSKMSALERFANNEDPQPTIVFTTFNGEMDKACEILDMAGYRTWMIRGGIGEGSRKAAIAESRKAVEAGETKIAVLIQIQAGNAGLNLQYMKRVIFMSSHWNPCMIDQAVGRAYRLGQRGSVEVHHFMLADGAEKNLDRYMAGLHSRKRRAAKDVHPDLFCDSAVESEVVFETLNEVCPEDDTVYMSEEEIAKEKARAETEAAAAEAKAKAKALKAAEKAAAKEKAKALKAEKAAAKEKAKADKAAAKEKAKAQKAAEKAAAKTITS